MKNKSEQFLISVAPTTRIALTRDQSFFYTFSRSLEIGTLVEIPIGRRKIEGVVTASSEDFPRETTFQLKKIVAVIEDAFLTKEQVAFAQHVSESCCAPLGIVLKNFLPKRTMQRSKEVASHKKPSRLLTTKSQEDLYKKITTSKKDELFIHATEQKEKIGALFLHIKEAVKKPDAQVLYLLPELMQTPYFSDFFYQFFSREKVVILHSRLSKGEYYSAWRKIKEGRARVIIGTRNAIFAPFSNLHTIIIDEAHDMSHKQWDHTPLFDIRIIAKKLSRLHSAKLILTSSSPRAVDYIHKEDADSDTEFIDHVTHSKPRISVIDMVKERWDKNKSPLSRELVNKIGHCVKNKKQTLLFVNRQGMSAFSLCSKCRTVVKCERCQRAAIMINKKEHKCIHCHQAIPQTKKCTKCKSPIEQVGLGTQRIHADLKKQFPKARIVVVDKSTMSKSRAHEDIYTAFKNGEIDILIGTQMITKQWHVDTIGLCAIVDMDHLLSLPNYTVNEKAFAFITQLALRTKNGEMLIQTFQPYNEVLQYAQKLDFQGFYEEEIALRKILKYPPYARLVKLLYQNPVDKEVDQMTKKVYSDLRELSQNEKRFQVSEPHDPLINKIRDKYRRQVVLKIEANTLPEELRLYLNALDIKWQIDIDPVQII